MESLPELIAEKTRINQEYTASTHRARVQSTTNIDVVSRSTETEIRDAEYKKREYTTQYQDIESRYRHDSSSYNTQRQIEENLSNIPKVISGELQPSDIPRCLLPLLKLKALITQQNERIIQQTQRLETVRNEESGKLSRAIQQLDNIRNSKLAYLRRRLIQATQESLQQLETDGIECLMH
jgi:hypothetical protein